MPFDRHSLTRLLTNVLYIGETKYKGKVYRGEQPGIVERSLWRGAHRLLENEKRGREAGKRNSTGALLKNLMVCSACGKSMSPTYTTKCGRRYCYYVCLTAQKRGAQACAGGLLSGPRIEGAVVRALFDLAGEAGGEALRERLPHGRNWQRANSGGSWTC